MGQVDYQVFTEAQKNERYSQWRSLYTNLRGLNELTRALKRAIQIRPVLGLFSWKFKTDHYGYGSGSDLTPQAANLKNSYVLNFLVIRELLLPNNGHRSQSIILTVVLALLRSIFTPVLAMCNSCAAKKRLNDFIKKRGQVISLDSAPQWSAGYIPSINKLR